VAPDRRNEVVAHIHADEIADGFSWEDVWQLREEARFWECDGSEGGVRLATYYRGLAGRVARAVDA
jgi:hypothetical protein